MQGATRRDLEDAIRHDLACARRLRTEVLPAAKPENVGGILRGICNALACAARKRDLIRNARLIA